jgi:hypothetical protein
VLTGIGRAGTSSSKAREKDGAPFGIDIGGGMGGIPTAGGNGGATGGTGTATILDTDSANGETTDIVAGVVIFVATCGGACTKNLVPAFSPGGTTASITRPLLSGCSTWIVSPPDTPAGTVTDTTPLLFTWKVDDVSL